MARFTLILSAVCLQVVAVVVFGLASWQFMASVIAGSFAAAVALELIGRPIG